MFGRHLKSEYKARMYQLVNEDHQITGTRYTSVREPIVVIAGASGFIVILLVFVTGTVLPLFSVVVPEATCKVIYAVLGLAGALWGYYSVTEPDTEEKTHDCLPI